MRQRHPVGEDPDPPPDGKDGKEHVADAIAAARAAAEKALAALG